MISVNNVVSTRDFWGFVTCGMTQQRHMRKWLLREFLKSNFPIYQSTYTKSVYFQNKKYKQLTRPFRSGRL